MGDQLISRGGLSKAINQATGGPGEETFIGIWDDLNGDSGLKLYLGQQSGVAYAYSPFQAPRVQLVADLTNLGSFVSIAQMGNYANGVLFAVMGASNTVFKKIVPHLSGSPLPTATTIFTIAGVNSGFEQGTFTIGSNTYIYRDAAAGVEIYKWNGSTAIVDDSTTSTSTDRLISPTSTTLAYMACVSGGAYTLRVLSGGVWSTFNTGTIVATSGAPLTRLAYFSVNSKYYAMCRTGEGSGSIQVYEITAGGATLSTQVDTPGAQTTIIMGDLLEYNGYLYLLWGGVLDTHYRLSRFDGTTWTSYITEVTLPAPEELLSSGHGSASLISYLGQLHIVTGRGATGGVVSKVSTAAGGTTSMATGFSYAREILVVA